MKTFFFFFEVLYLSNMNNFSYIMNVKRINYILRKKKEIIIATAQFNH